MRGRAPRLFLPFRQWPASDRRLWEQAIGSDDPFSANGGARLATATQNSYMFGWRRFLGYLALHEPRALEASPIERVTIERIRSFTAHLAETNSPRSVAGSVDAVYKAARLIMPDRDWAWLKAVKARLYRAAPRHAPSGPVITSLQLLDLGQQLMEESMPAPGTPLSLGDAIRYRDGLMFALVAFIPLRPKNLADLEIGRHIVREGNGWFVIVPREETKTRTPIEFSVPELLESDLVTYLEIVRPRIIGRQTCTALWLNRFGDALSYAAIALIFSRHSTLRLGFHIAPHDARDAAATTWALSAPDRIGIARDLLGHSDLRTTIRHYNRARGLEASRAHGRVLSAMRRRQDRRPRR
jgi:integrase